MMLFICFAIGFCAQIIDGTLGMAYGVCCNTFLKAALGMSSLVSSAVVHFSEMFTSAISALSHYKLKNFNKKIFLSLVIPGVLGGVLGAAILSEYGSFLEDAVSVYLILTGLLILWSAFRGRKASPKRRAAVYPLAFVGGLLDATGGGGWGPVVTSSMLCMEEDTSAVIGSVNAAEFFVTIAETAVFSMSFAYVGQYWKEALFLIAGGICAAPVAAILCNRINNKILMVVVGLLVIALNAAKLL